jgi:uncharacterized membrane protein YfcA
MNTAFMLSAFSWLLYMVIGLGAGTLSGLTGIGGGIIIVPALTYLVGLSQHQAQGTTLALMVLPIGLLAAWSYYKQGYVDIKIAGLVALGFFCGGWLGAKLAVKFSTIILTRSFSILLLAVGLKMLISTFC